MKNKKSIFKSLLIITFLITALVLSSCGSDSENQEIKLDETAYTEGAAPEANTALGNNSESVAVDKTAKIIRTIDIDGETKDFDIAVDAIKSRVAEFDGYVEKSELSGGQSLYSNSRSQKRALLVIRVPAEKLDKFLDETNELLNVTGSSESTKDITLDYYDVEARLNTLKTKRTALETMLEQAKSLDDMLLIQDNLYKVIADIEAYQSQLNQYDNKVNYSTVNLEIYEVAEYTVIEEPSFWERTKTAFKESWQGFGKFWINFAVFVVRIFPALIILSIFAAIITPIAVKYKRFKQKKKAEKD